VKGKPEMKNQTANPIQDGSMQFMSPKQMVSAVRIITCILLLSLFSPASADAPDLLPPLSKRDLTDTSLLLKLYRLATSDDEDLARKWLKIADEDLSRKNYSGAAKRYGESAIRKPTVKAVLRISVAYAVGRHEHDTCEKELALTFRFFDHAFHLFRAGLEFHEALAEESDLDDAAILRFQEQLLKAQEKLFVLQRKCLNPDTR
jgi:hypothetical protein